jgi:hypothetical protein
MSDVKEAKLSALERAFLTRLLQLAPELPLPLPGHSFLASRQWKFDFAWPTLKVAVELEGGTFSGGRHVRGVGYAKDCEKYNAAALEGWLLLRYTSDMLSNDPAAVIQDVKTALWRAQGAADVQRHLLVEIARLREALSMTGEL